MKIVVDENMPYAQELFSRKGEVVRVPGRPLPVGELQDAQALMVRSVTPVNTQLVADTPLAFVGSATAGTDHVELSDLEAAAITFSAAPGCNAIAVVEYVLSALLLLAERDGYQLCDKTIGIVGVGNVGSRLQARCEALGMKVLLCDPPRADRGDNENFLSLDSLVTQADILTFHTPLIKQGDYQTWHCVDGTRLEKLRPGCVLINACRGAVVDNQALKQVLTQRNDLSVVLDVWEPEPHLDQQLLADVDIGTAHIAGYTLEGKVRGTTQLYEAWTAFIGQPESITLSELLPPPDICSVEVTGEFSQSLLKRLAHLVYDVRRDDALLRLHIGDEGGFDRLRKQYQERREWSSLAVTCSNASTAERLRQLGFNTLYCA
ncbi:4-phosphoerythronate dehydrogenase PdxB [Rosenbergiella sp. S61]|uniref:Erythronate-4-phosphate dehydrogenase n=1 Tax=Rosenbergiella gaditana TaxID=2726987 RepID=A0ABS5SVG0_9GAMM|nr:4-phosphoerythronate dehydrogenase PdxB [Rosenbergiella gaditana]MBT0724081.1 4-phosphoerythronate dehydrogenase PdxB [Rosenbergiella gaditana]